MKDIIIEAIFNVDATIGDIRGTTLDDIVCQDRNGAVVEINKDDVNTEIDRLQAAYDVLEYARKRKEEYDALNQFELISDDDANGTTTHKDAIAAIKTKWPKDNSGPK